MATCLEILFDDFLEGTPPKKRRSRPRKPKLTKTDVTALVKKVYEGRRDRDVHPEGKFDSAGRWYPSEIEDADGDGTCVRSPSRAWPYSYMLRCRTRQHCRVLVERGLEGKAVPDDVGRVVGEAQRDLQARIEEWERGYTPSPFWRAILEGDA